MEQDFSPLEQQFRSRRVNNIRRGTRSLFSPLRVYSIKNLNVFFFEFITIKLSDFIQVHMGSLWLGVTGRKFVTLLIQSLKVYYTYGWEKLHRRNEQDANIWEIYNKLCRYLGYSELFKVWHEVHNEEWFYCTICLLSNNTDQVEHKRFNFIMSLVSLSWIWLSVIPLGAQLNLCQNSNCGHSAPVHQFK